MNFKKTFLIILFLFVLSGLFPVINIYCNNSDNGISSEEISLIRNFEEQTKKSIEAANLFIKNKEPDKAKKELENTLNLVNEQISSYGNKAQNLVSEDKNNSAKIYYREASSLGKISIKISQSLKEIAILQEKNEGKKSKEESENYIMQGFEYLKSSNLDGAESSFNKALDIFPDNRKAKDGLVRVGNARRRMNAEHISNLLEEASNNINMEAFDEAEKGLKEVLTLQPDNSKAQGYLEKIEKLRQAKEDKDLLANIDSKIEEGKNNLKMGRFEEAETGLNEALKLLLPQEKKRRGEIESLLASVPELKQKYQAGANLGRIENIVSEAKQQIEENKLGELIKRGKEYLTANNFEEAKKKFLEALQIRPGNELVLQYLSETEQAKKDYESKGVIEGLITEGKKYLEAEQLDKADAIFRKALKIASSGDKQTEIQTLLDDIDKTKQNIYNRKLQQQADVYIASGVDNFNKNQYAKARTNFEKALSVKPDYSEAEEWLKRLDKSQEEANQSRLQTMMTEGKEYLKDNKFDLAKAKFEEVLNLNPTYSEALSSLDLVEKARDEYKNKQQFDKVKVVIDNGMKYLAEGQFDKAESIFKDAVGMASPQIKEQVVKTIESDVNSFIHKNDLPRRVELQSQESHQFIESNNIKEDSAKMKVTEELGNSELEKSITQLMEQIKNKINESEKILEREN